MTKVEALNNARSLVQQAVDVANMAGIDPAHVVAPHCADTAPRQDDRDGPGPENLRWCGVSVIIDNDTSELFEMSQPDDDPEQKPAFLVTQSTATLVRQDFERYEPSLERMAEDWQESKKPLLIQKTSDSE
ncbi:MAG: hypothetical protein AABN95_12930 [Acidobacteriota bacterium]